MLSENVEGLFEVVHDVVLQNQALQDANNRIITGGYASQPPSMSYPAQYW